MPDQNKTRERLISEIAELRQQVAELQTVEVKWQQAEAARKEVDGKTQAILDSVEGGYYEANLTG